MDDRKDLRDLTPKALENWLSNRGHQRFRADQIKEWLYRRLVSDPQEMKNLPQNLRRDMAREFRLFFPAEREKLVSADGTIKYGFGLHDGEFIETVAIPERGRLTACISTQAGCRMGCRFCRTGAGGFRRNLDPSEIVGQVMALGGGERVGNIMVMGMGEPLDNVEALLASLCILCDRRGAGFAPRRITVSTIGSIPGIDRLGAEGPPVNLALSFHSAVDRTREGLMPAARGRSLKELRAALRRFPLGPRRRITLEVVLVSGVNDSPAEARAMARFAGGLPAKVNIIPFNPFPGAGLEAPGRKALESYQSLLREKGIDAFIRKSRGGDILAACGQLGRPSSG